ncbi:MAG: glycosyltransferase family 2 protein [Alloprevotella sp.]|nr:glycosyltransferase family 2 protein [Alloprevotella sp.]
MKLSVIIVSYNVKHYLAQCLRSVLRATEGIEAEVFVVDNASEDGTLEHLRRLFPPEAHPQLNIVPSGENLGFGRANNLAVERSSGDYVLFLNPDTIVAEHTLRACLDFAGRHPDLGALGVKMLCDNGTFAYESRRGLPSPWTAFCKMSGLGALFPRSRTFGRYYMRYLDADEPARIDIVSGAFMLVPRAALGKVGLFDEQFFMYGEDVDLSYRLLQGGFQNYYLPVPILHYKGESTRKTSFRYIHNFYHAMLLFFRKHYGHLTLLLSFPVQLAIVGRALLALVVQKFNNLKAFVRPARRNAAPETDCLLSFDGEAQSYADILSALEHSDHTRYLGIRYPGWHVLITGGDVVSLPS